MKSLTLSRIKVNDSRGCLGLVYICDKATSKAVDLYCSSNVLCSGGSMISGMRWRLYSKGELALHFRQVVQKILKKLKKINICLVEK